MSICRCFLIIAAAVSAASCTSRSPALSAAGGAGAATDGMDASDESQRGEPPSVDTPEAGGVDSGSLPKRPAGPCMSPYAPPSPFNQPIADGTATSPMSDVHLAEIDRPLYSNAKSWTMAVYHVDATTPLRSMQINDVYSDVTISGGEQRLNRKVGGISIRIPIPNGAVPAAPPLSEDPNSDAQLIIVDLTTGDEWGFWRAQRLADGNYRAVNGYHYNINWTGVPPAGFGSRGAGIPYLAGLIRRCEIERGAIEHALAFAYDSPSSSWVYPATKSDGRGTSRDLPEGARLQLNPDISDSTISNSWGCRGTCFTVAKALQKYGMIVVDHSGASKLFFEWDGTADWGDRLDLITTKPIPLSEFRVLAY